LERKPLVCVIVFLFIVPTVGSAAQTYDGNDPIMEKLRTFLIRGHVAYAFVAYSENLSGLVEFDLDDPGNLTGDGNSSNPNFYAGADFDFEGNLYCVDYAGGIYLINIDDGTATFIGSSIGMNGLCFDTTSSTWYGTSANCLYIVDVTSGATTLVGSHGITNTLIDISCDNDGNMYGYDVLWSGHSSLYSINKSTGQATPIGDMGYGFIYAQDSAYDRDNGIFYVAGYFNDGNPSALLICDTQTAACTIVDNIQYGAELDGFAIPFGSPNQNPSADFTFYPLHPPPGETVFFYASSSYDSDGFITLYEWDWDHDGDYEDASTNPAATHIWTYPGSYRVVLQVTDNEGLTGRKTKTVNILNNPPSPPNIDGPSTGTVNHVYIFSLGSITDPEGDSLYCQWDWGDGNITDWLSPYPSGSTISSSYAWNNQGVYAMKARVKDIYGAMSNWSESHIITIAPNKPPDTPTLTGPAKGKSSTTYLYSFETTDPENDSVYYYLDWGDGANTGWLGPYTPGVQTGAAHSWTQNGTYVIKVKAKDTWGAESDWGTLSVKIPYSYTIPVLLFLKWFFTYFPYAFPLLRCLLEGD